MLLWQKATGKGSTPYAWDHYDEWRRVGAPPHRVCDEGSIKTSVNKLRKSLRNKRNLPRTLMPLDDVPLLLRQASEGLPTRSKDSSRLVQSAVVLPPLEAKNKPTEAKAQVMRRVSSESLSLGSEDSSPYTQSEGVALPGPSASTQGYALPPVSGMIPPEDIWHRWHFDGTGFMPGDVSRIRQAFDLFKISDVSEINREDLPMAVQHLGMLGVIPEAVEELAMEVTTYSALSLADFTAFLEKYATQELADITKAFHRHAKHSKVPLKALSPLLHELGFTSLQRSIFETLTNAALTMKALSLQQLLRFLAAHCSSGGFTAQQLTAAREAFDAVRQGKEEIAPQGVGAALALFFGQDAYEKWNLLWKRMRGENRNAEEEHDVWTMPLVDFRDFISMARLLQVEELSELHGRFQLVDHDQDGAVVEGEFLRLLPEDSSLLICGKVSTLLADAQIQVGQLMTFDDVFDVVSLTRTTSSFTKGEVQELEEAFERFDEDKSGKIDVLEMVEMLLYMGFSSSLEHVHQIIHLSDADGNEELDFREFLHVMSMHELTHTKALRDAFKDLRRGSETCTQAQLGDLLQQLGYFPGADTLKEILQEEDMQKRKEFDFTAARLVTDHCRRHFAKMARCNAYFPEAHIKLLETFFKEQLLSSSDRLERGGLICLLQALGVPINTLQERDAILQELVTARRTAEEAGADVGEGSAITFPVLLHLLRRFASNGQMLVMARELKAMKDAKVSHLEVVEFRQVFNQLAIEAKTEKKPEPVAPAGRRRSMADLNSMVALAASTRDNDPDFQELKASLFIGGRALTISVTALIGMLRSLGVRISERQLLELTNKVNDLASLDQDPASQEVRLLGQGVDFAVFLRVIRWMLDVNFGDINGATSRVDSKAKQAPNRVARAAAQLENPELAPPPPARTQRRRASVI